MQKSKGISMISLIVTIACIILLSSLAIGTGVKYLRESKERDKTNFISLLSNAVSKREEETNVNSLGYPYLGYYISDSSIFELVFAPKIGENVLFENGIWYVVDNTSAAGLGVKQSEKYISSIDESLGEEVTVALVNYLTGDVYMINVTPDEVSGLNLSKENVIVGHKHRYIIETPTCTEAVKCADCGFILKEALGHSYDNTLATPEPADDASHYNKTCSRCNMKGGYEPHIFGYTHTEEAGVWYHRSSCSVCGWEDLSRTECIIQYTLPTSDTQKRVSHIKTCRTCRYTRTEAHTFGYRSISESMHEEYCTDPKCGYVRGSELHSDNDMNGFCDKCLRSIIDYGYPQLTTVTINKKDASGDEAYYAKIGDTVVINFVADRPIQNVSVKIGGQAVSAQNIQSTVDLRTWTVEFQLLAAHNIANGKLGFEINCESQNGIEMVGPVTTTIDKKYVIYDGTAPTIEYIKKQDLVSN